MRANAYVVDKSALRDRRGECFSKVRGGVGQTFLKNKCTRIEMLPSLATADKNWRSTRQSLKSNIEHMLTL